MNHSKLGRQPDHILLLTLLVSYDRYQIRPRRIFHDEIKQTATGQVYNLGSHLIDQVVSLFGRPNSVTGMVENIREIGEPEVDDSVSDILSMKLRMSG